MRFIADSMLGRLARWLRMLGYDTLYSPHIEDSILLRIAREEERTLLTRDTRLVKVRGLKNFLLLIENDPFQQLKDVIMAFGLTPYRTSHGAVIPLLASRCSLCNTVLNSISREEVKEQVPKYVFLTTDSFKKCLTCNKLYWKGTHQEKFQNTLMKILYG